MPKPSIGLLLAVGVAAMPLAAHANCPPESSIDRYVETASDALSALDGLVPDSQQRALEDRATAMIVLKWNWQGRSTLESDPPALTQLVACYKSDRCSLDPSIGMNKSDSDIASRLIDSADAHTQLASLLTERPSYRILDWAEATLECVRTNPAPEPSAEADMVDPVDDERSIPETAELAADTPDGPAEGALERPDAEADIPADADPAVDGIAADETPAEPAPNSDAASAYLAGLDPDLLEQTPERLLETAASFVVSGKASDAVAPLRAACFLEATTKEISSACDTLSDVYNSNAVTGAPLANSPAYLEHSKQLCDLDYRRGCLNLSQHFRSQTTQDAHLATVYYTERACALGDGEACATVAGYYLKGRASNPDPILALEKLEQSCALGRFLSCQEAADFHLRGVGGEVDVDQAFGLNEAACPSQQATRADACVAAADFVLINMQSSPERSARVRTFIQRACAIGHDVGCAWYAEDLELGIGGAVDLAGAKKARVTACEYGHTDSCNSRS